MWMRSILLRLSKPHNLRGHQTLKKSGWKKKILLDEIRPNWYIGLTYINQQTKSEMKGLILIRSDLYEQKGRTKKYKHGKMLVCHAKVFESRKSVIQKTKEGFSRYSRDSIWIVYLWSIVYQGIWFTTRIVLILLFALLSSFGSYHFLEIMWWYRDLSQLSDFSFKVT